MCHFCVSTFERKPNKMTTFEVPSLDSVLDKFPRHPQINHAPHYLLQFVHPGGFRNFREGLSFRRAMKLADIDGMNLGSIDNVKLFQAAITFYEPYLNTLSIDTKATGFRQNGEIYYFPKCPRGYPLDKLHHYAFEGEQEMIKKYDDLLALHSDWIDVIESGIPDAEKEKLFLKVSDSTHGTHQEFLMAWIKLHREQYEGDNMKILYALRVHNLIIQYRPFVRGNGRLARLLLCQNLVQNHLIPPYFWSEISYRSKLPALTGVNDTELTKKKEKLPSLRTINLENETEENKLNIIKEIEETTFKLKVRFFEEKKFLCYLLSQCIDAAEVSQIKVNQLRPAEGWETIVDKDPNRALEAYVSMHKRVLLSDVLMAFSLFLPNSAKGKDGLQDKVTKKWHWNGMDKSLVDLIESTLTRGNIKLAPAFRQEYESRGHYPKINSNWEIDNWAPMVLVSADKKA